MHEADEPDALADLFDANGLTGDRFAEADLFAIDAESAAASDGDLLSVNLSSINRRINPLEGICPEAITLLQDKQFTQT